MTDERYARGARPPLRRRNANAVGLVAGVVVLGVLAAILALIVLTRNSDDGTASASSSASPSVTARTSASAGTSPSSTASAGAGGDGPAFATLEPLSVVESVVDGVTVREEAGTGAERVGTLAEGSQNIVIEGPVEADGYAWYRMAAIGLPPSSGCVTPLPTDPMECPIWLGWAAAGDPDSGEAWFAVTEPDCPDPDGATHDFMLLPQRMPLACNRGDEITFTAWYPQTPGDEIADDCDADPAIAWLYCGDAPDDVWSSESESVAFEKLFVDPDADITMPERDQWLRITGAYDHPDSPGCVDANMEVGLYDTDALALLECRVRFVATAVETTSAP